MQSKKILVALAAVAGLSSLSAHAVNLVVNGDFETTTNGPLQFDNNTVATGWTSNGYNFLFGPGTADTTGSSGSYGFLALWGPNNGSANGLTNSPTGGNFVAADGAFQVAPIEQTIHGLVAGQQYKVGFDWAGAQQLGFTGANTEQWEVKLGSESHSTAVYSNPSQGFSGWMHESFTFTATSGTEVLSFLAHGTPDGVPPFSLLDGVKMTAAVPEPATWALMLGGFGLVGFSLRKRGAKLAV
jgi:hypothetical protein